MLKHLRVKYPDAYITLETMSHREACFRHLVDELRPLVYPWDMWRGDINKYVTFGHANKDCGFAPCTKVTQCLLNEFNDIKPDTSLYTYSVSVLPEAYATIAKWYNDTLPPGPVVLIHSEGISHPKQKNIPRPLIATMCETLIDHGITPLLLDWGDNKNGLIEGVYQTKDLPRDSDHLAAIIECADFFVGIDSGPGHMASALETPSYIFWLDMFPGHNFDLSANPDLLHWICQESIDASIGDEALSYFYNCYRYTIYDEIVTGIDDLTADLVEMFKDET